MAIPGGKVMKAMNILVISLVVVVVSLFLFNEKAEAREGIVIGNIAIIHTWNDATKELEILVYHEPSNSFLIYRYSLAHKLIKGLQLMHIRKLDDDFALAESIETSLEYEKGGYNYVRIKSMLKKTGIKK